ncbi:MAG: hypothetical protein Q8J67_07800 [Rhodocyclaceae bacterium]|nr:hypothetical protein [Rhodocyclaceae bacterium]
MRRLKSFLLILIALWLPVQTAAAMAMPFCGHAGEPSAQAMVADSPAPCHEHVVPAADPASGAGVSDLGCDNCEMCHLASAGYIPPAAANLPLAVAGVFVARSIHALHSHIAAPPQQPPRRLS